MSTVKEILVAAHTLSPQERGELIASLWETLVPEDWPAPSEAVMREVRRRSAEIDAGKMSAEPWNKVRERVRREVGLDD